jgi:hypothetical protein
MAVAITKPVRVVKQVERREERSSLATRDLLTDAQQKRAMVSVVSSWIREQRKLKAIPTTLFRLEPEENEQNL